MLTMDPKSWRLYALPLSVCSVVLDFPPLLLGCATTALILKLLWRSCLSLFFRTHKPCAGVSACHSLGVPTRGVNMRANARRGGGGAERRGDAWGAPPPAAPRRSACAPP